MGNGLALIALAVGVTPDPKVTEQGVALDDDVHQGTLIERRTRRLRHLLDGDGSAIRYHLAQNPTDTQTMLQMIINERDKGERLRLEWLDRMRTDGAIQEADYESARAAVLGVGSASPPVLEHRLLRSLAERDTTDHRRWSLDCASTGTGRQPVRAVRSGPRAGAHYPGGEPSATVRPEPLHGTVRIRMAGRPGTRGPAVRPAPHTAAPRARSGADDTC